MKKLLFIALLFVLAGCGSEEVVDYDYELLSGTEFTVNSLNKSGYNNDSYTTSIICKDDEIEEDEYTQSYCIVVVHEDVVEFIKHSKYIRTINTYESGEYTYKDYKHYGIQKTTLPKGSFSIIINDNQEPELVTETEITE